MTLYELTGDFLQLQEMLESGEYEGDIIMDTLESVEYDLETKVENYGKIIRNFEGDITALEAEIERLKKKVSSRKNRVQNMKDALRYMMNQTGKKIIDAGVFKFSVRKNGGKVPFIVDMETDMLPEQFVKIKREPDKAALEKYTKETGDYTYGHFGERGEYLFMS